MYVRMYIIDDNFPDNPRVSHLNHYEFSEPEVSRAHYTTRSCMPNLLQ
jgi:hypothetical protein